MSPSDDDIASDMPSSEWNGDSDDSDEDLQSSVGNLASNRSSRHAKTGSESLVPKSKCGTRATTQREGTGRASHPPKSATTQRRRSHVETECMPNKSEVGGASCESQPSMLASDTPQHVANVSAQQPGKCTPDNAGREEDSLVEQKDEHAEAVRAANIKALLSDTVHAERTTLMPKFLKVGFRLNIHAIPRNMVHAHSKYLWKHDCADSLGCFGPSKATTGTQHVWYVQHLPLQEDCVCMNAEIQESTQKFPRRKRK